MAKGEQKSPSKILIILLLIAGAVLLWIYNKQLLLIISAYATLVMVGVILFVVLPAVFLVFLPYLSRLYFYYRRMNTMETVRIVLSRRDEKNSSDMINFFDFLNGVLLPEFYSYYLYRGANTFVWEVRVEKGNQKNIYISATGGLLKMITQNLQAVHPNIRFEKVEHEERPVPNEFMQMKLERSWKHSIETGEMANKMGPIKYEKSLTDSLFSTMDAAGHDEEAGIQFVITPVSPRVQQRKRFKHNLSQVGGAMFECEIRLYAPNKQIQKGIIGTVGEVNANNNIIAERLLTYRIRKLIRNYWWKYVFEKKMPSLFMGPTMWFMSFHLAALLQLPSPDLRVAGLSRHIHRRLPIPQGIPEESEIDIPLLETEDGRKIGMTEAMKKRNLLIVGTGGTGKSTLLAQFGIPAFADPDQACVIVASNPIEAQIFLQYVPPHKKLYIIDMDTPGEYGINFLSLDHFPADIMVEFLISCFDMTFPEKIPDLELIKQALYALREAREVSPEWKKAVPTIDLRHIREVLANEKYRIKLIQGLPRHSPIRSYWIERTQHMRNPRYFVRYVTPILDAFTRVLSNERLAKTYCHPNTLDVYKALIEEKAVVLLHGGKWEFGFDINTFSGNMFLSLVYLATYKMQKAPAEEKVKLNFLLDDFGGLLGRAIMMLCVRGGRLDARIGATTGSFFDIPDKFQIIMNIAFANKIIMRTHHQKEAEHWAHQVEQLEAEDFLHLKQFNAAAWFLVDNDRKDIFLANTLFNRELAKWNNYHPWPTENKNLTLNKLVLPTMADDDLAGDIHVSFKKGKSI